MWTKLGARWPSVLFFIVLLAEVSHATLQSSDARNYSTWMLNSIIADGDGVGSSGAATSQIELVRISQSIGCIHARTYTDVLQGVFQEALRQGIESAAFTNPRQALEWTEYYELSVASSGLAGFTNVTMDLSQPLDRLSIGRSLVVE